MCGEHSADAPRIAHQVGKVYRNGACGTSLIAALSRGRGSNQLENSRKGEARALIADPSGKLHPHRGPWLDSAAKHRFGAAGADTQQENMVHKVANKVTWLLLGLPTYAVCFRECVLADEVALFIVLVEDIQHAPRVLHHRRARSDYTWQRDRTPGPSVLPYPACSSSVRPGPAAVVPAILRPGNP